MKRLPDYFKPFLVYLEEKGYAPITIKEHKRFLYGSVSHAVHNGQLLIQKDISKLTELDIEAILKAGEQHGRYGRRETALTLRSYLRYLKREGIKLFVDWRDVEVPRVPPREKPYIGVKQFNEFVRAIPIRDIYGLRERALFELLLPAGLRISEALALQNDDIDWEREEVRVEDAKSGEEFILGLSHRCLYWLKKYLKKKKRNVDCSALFVNRYGNPLLSGTCRAYLMKLRKETGVNPRISHHTPRRALATILIEKTMDLKAVQYSMRHKSPLTTLYYYAQVDRKRARKIHRKIINRI